MKNKNGTVVNKYIDFAEDNATEIDDSFDEMSYRREVRQVKSEKRDKIARKKTWT